MEWIEGNRLKIDPPAKPKKITGTRFAAILGKSPWATPFEIWCEICRVYQKPFEGTKYTEAGKTIEPKQADYMKRSYFMTHIIRPSDIYGEDYFKKTYGDFFPQNKVFGGMWDYLNDDTVLEMKTSKRVEDWETDIPEYYALQAALYAYLKQFQNVVMVASFLEEKDYDSPEEFVPSSKNTIVRPFALYDRYPEFHEHIDYCLQWWEMFVEAGVSPPYDEKRDAEILKVLRTKCVDVANSDKEDLLREAETLKAELDENSAKMKDKEDRYKKIVEAFKFDSVNDFTPGTNEVDITGSKYVWRITQSGGGLALDEDAMKADGVFEKYLTKQKPKTLKITAYKLNGK